MPKMIGNTPTRVARELGIIISTAPEAARTAAALAAPAGMARVTWGTLRAMSRAGFLLGRGVRAVLVATDKGGPGCLAKRWWAWYVPAVALAAYRAEHPLRVTRPR
jgi:hypothetical protein